jgi:hypothetical protein
LLMPFCNRDGNLAMQNGRGDPFPAIWEAG